MDIKTCIVTLLSIVVVNNLVISRASGLPNAMVKNSKALKANATYSALVVGVTGILAYFVNAALVSVNMTYLSVFLTAVIALAVAYALKNPLKVSETELVMTVFNGAVMALAFNVFGSESALVAVYTSVLAALGYAGAMYTYAGVVSRIDNKAVPAAFKGLPIEMVALGIVALAALAFK